jgi:TniQ
VPAWDTPARRLPITVRPAAGELLGSYLLGLAKANRLPVRVLVSWVGRPTATDISRGQDAWLNEPAVLRLASIAGLAVDGLRCALPALTQVRAFADTNGPTIRLMPASASGPAQQACHRCTARSVPGAVLVRAAAHQPLCQRHKLWLRDWRAPLDHAPELLHAQRQHCRQVRRHGSGGRAERAHTAAAWIVLMWALKDWHRELHEVWNDRLSRLGVTQTIVSGSGRLAAMTYPEVVTLTGLLAQPAWTARRGTGPAAWPRLLAAVQRKLPVESSSFDARDPLTTWLATAARWDAQPAAGIPPIPAAARGRH